MGKLAKNVVYLLASDFAIRFLTAITTLLVARNLGPELFGMLNAALAVSYVAAYFADLGTLHTMIREGTKPGADLSRLVGGGLRLRFLFAVGTTLVSSVFIFLAFPDEQLRQVVLMVTLPAIWGNAVQGIGIAYFQMIQEMQYVALIRTVSGIMVSGVLLAAVFFGWPLHILALAYGVSSLVGGILGAVLVIRRIPIAWGRHEGLKMGLLSFTFGGLITMILPQLGPLILPHVASFADTGHFAAAYRIPAVLYAVPGVVAAAFYPQLFHHGARNLDLHLQLSVKQIRLMGLLGLVMGIPLSVHASWVIQLLFGEKWGTETANLLTMLAWVVVLQSISFPLADALTTQGLQARRTQVLVLGVSLGGSLFLLLGGKWGAYGGALATLVVEVGLLIGFLISNPARTFLLRQGLGMVVRYAGVALPLTLLLKTFIGEGWISLATTVLVVPAAALALDKELRMFVRQALEPLRKRLSSD